MQEQAARRFWLMILDIAERVFVDMCVMKPGLLILDPSKSIGNLGLARAEGFWV